jgi:hypothetical protein
MIAVAVVLFWLQLQWFHSGLVTVTGRHHGCRGRRSPSQSWLWMRWDYHGLIPFVVIVMVVVVVMVVVGVGVRVVVTMPSPWSCRRPIRGLGHIPVVVVNIVALLSMSWSWMYWHCHDRHRIGVSVVVVAALLPWAWAWACYRCCCSRGAVVVSCSASPSSNRGGGKRLGHKLKHAKGTHSPQPRQCRGRVKQDRGTESATQGHGRTDEERE